MGKQCRAQKMGSIGSYEPQTPAPLQNLYISRLGHGPWHVHGMGPALFLHHDP